MILDYNIEDLVPGLTHSFEVKITEDMLNSFATISGDLNPLHTDAEVAKARGFKDRVVHGMLTSAAYSKLVGHYLPGNKALLQSIEIAFHNPVFVNDQLTVEGQIEHVSFAVNVVQIKALIRNQLGVRISKAKIRVGIKV